MSIEVRHLVKKYGDHYAVNDLSFQLESGRIYGLLGPNGAGKSTTMNMMTGYIASTSGEVIINGHNILTEPREAKRCIGYLPEIPPLYADMTVMEYLLTVAQLKKIPKAEQSKMLEEIMDTVKISEMRNRLIKNLSKGYKQRVGIAQALVGYPEIVILDEPTVGLDPKQIIEIRDLVKSLSQKHTVIISSHILSEVSAVCDDILIINKGRLIAFDRAENLGSMFHGQNKLELVVEGAKDSIWDVLKSFEEIQYADVMPAQEQPGAFRIDLKMREDTDIRRELFFRFAEIGCPILELRKVQISLEDIFLKLTDSEKKNANRQAGMPGGEEQK